jgi:hypothetical protein
MTHVELRPPVDPTQSERLLQFSLDSGVDCFTVTLVYWEKRQLRRANTLFFDRLAPFSLGKRLLERTVVPEGGERIIPMESWALNPQTIKLILEGCGGSLTAYEMGRLPEDWTFYRDGSLFMGVVSHEQYAFLRLPDTEFERFRRLELPFSVRG